MKKETKREIRKTVIQVVIILLIDAIIIASIFGLYSKYEIYQMKYYFDGWKSETEQDFTIAFLDRLYFNPPDESQSLYLREIDGGENGSVGAVEVYCIKNGRIYFCNYEEFKYEDSTRRNCFMIMSVDLNGEDLKVHISLDSFGYDYKQYAYTTTYEEIDNIGGIYYDGQIFLKVNEKVIVYDIETDTTKEVDEVPANHYSVTVEDKKVIIEDPETNQTRTITHEKMAEKNIYAQKLFETLEFNDESLDEFFKIVKIEDDNIYIICCVNNWSWDAFCVVFKYDFDSEDVSYASFLKVYDDDLIDSDYFHIIPVE